MTRSRNLKNEVHAYMVANDVKYTDARRAVLARRPGQADAVSEIGRLMTPGSITAVLSSGGANNFAMAAPKLSALLAAGHPLVHSTGGRQGLLSLPGDFDFAVHAGIASGKEIVDALVHDAGFEELLAKMEPMMSNTTRLESRCPRSTLSDLLNHRGLNGQSAVLWVQDFDDGGPIALGGPELRYHDELAVQMPVLRSLADETGAIIALGHLGDDLIDRDSWRLILEHSNTTFVSARDWTDPDSENTWLVFDGTAERGLVRGQGSIEPWRYEYVQRRQAA